jgi:hypothetical protein
VLSRIKSAGGDGFPSFPRADFGVKLLFPQYFEGLTLSIVVHARHPNESRVPLVNRTDHLIYQVKPLPYSDDLAFAGCGLLACHSETLCERLRGSWRHRPFRNYFGGSD